MKRDLAYLFHIRDSITLILSYTQGLSESDFCSKTMIKDAVIRNFEVIGEATKRISMDLRNQYPNIQWSKMAGLRDKLIHDYMEVDVKIVWGVVEKLLPSLKNDIDFILSKIRP